MANVQKYTRANVSGGGLIQHFERTKDENGEYHKWGNQDIDPSRSHLNYNLAPDRGSVMGDCEGDLGIVGDGGQWSFLQRRLSEVHCHKREDVNILCSWIITAPQSLFGGWNDDDRRNSWSSDNNNPNELLDPTTSQNLRKFFEESYKFLNNKYSNGTDKNVMSAYVHMDETTPHLHYAFIPVVWNEKKQREKVSAKEALDWSGRGLNKFHPELEAHMEKVFGFQVGILNEATKDGNKTVTELKRQTALDEQRKIADEQEKIKSQALSTKSDLEQTQNQLTVTKVVLDDIEGELSGVWSQLQEAKFKLKETETQLNNTNNDLRMKKAELNEVKLDIEGAKVELSEAEVKLEAITHPTSGKFALEKRINELANSGKETTIMLGKNKGKPKTTFTFDGSLSDAMTVFDAARDRANMREREKKAIEKRDEAISQRDNAIKNEGIALNRLAGVERREIDVLERESNATQREENIKIAQRNIAKELANVDKLYSKQLKLNELYETSIDKIVDLEEKLGDEQKNNGALRSNIKNKQTEIDKLKTELKGAYWSVSALSCAAGSLLWEDGLKISNPTQKQEVLLKAMRQYGAKHTRDAGFDDIADYTNKHYGLSEGLQSDVDELTPKPPVRGRDWGPSL